MSIVEIDQISCYTNRLFFIPEKAGVVFSQSDLLNNFAVIAVFLKGNCFLYSRSNLGLSYSCQNIRFSHLLSCYTKLQDCLLKSNIFFSRFFY